MHLHKMSTPNHVPRKICHMLFVLPPLPPPYLLNRCNGPTSIGDLIGKMLRQGPDITETSDNLTSAIPVIDKR